MRNESVDIGEAGSQEIGHVRLGAKEVQAVVLVLYDANGGLWEYDRPLEWCSYVVV